MIDRRRPASPSNDTNNGNLKPTRFRDLADVELEASLRIDRNALEDVCCTHPELLYEVSNRLAMLVSQRDESRQNLKEAEAKADSEIRHDAEVAGDKITEKAIESQKMIHPKVIAARNVAFDLEKKCGQATVLKEAFHARGYAVRDLIQLYIANYYGSNMERSGHDMQRAGAVNARQKQAENFRR